MSRFSISPDEWWPVYELSSGEENPAWGRIELADTEIAEYKRVVMEFSTWQRRFAEAVHGKDAVQSWRPRTEDDVISSS